MENAVVEITGDHKMLSDIRMLRKNYLWELGGNKTSISS